MPAHFLFGEDFVIRFGFPGEIQWFNMDARELAIQTPGLLAPWHPAQIALQAAPTVANFEAWWNLRKVNILQVAKFEERRILWVIDSLQHWFSELGRGELRLDSVFYLERELAKYFQKAQEEELIEIPSSLLLQIDRAAMLQETINHGLISIMKSSVPGNFPISGVCEFSEISYLPFNRMHLLKNSWEAIEELWKKLSSYESVAAMLHPFGCESFVPEMLRKTTMTKKRANDYSPISQFAYEILWTKNLAAILKAQKGTLLRYKRNQISFATEPEEVLPDPQGEVPKQDT